MVAPPAVKQVEASELLSRPDAAVVSASGGTRSCSCQPSQSLRACRRLHGRLRALTSLAAVHRYVKPGSSGSEGEADFAWLVTLRDQAA